MHLCGRGARLQKKQMRANFDIGNVVASLFFGFVFLIFIRSNSVECRRLPKLHSEQRKHRETKNPKVTLITYVCHHGHEESEEKRTKRRTSLVKTVENLSIPPEFGI